MDENSTVVQISSHETVDFSLSIKKVVGVSIVGTLDLNFTSKGFRLLSASMLTHFVRKYVFKQESNLRVFPCYQLVQRKKQLIKFLIA